MSSSRSLTYRPHRTRREQRTSSSAAIEPKKRRHIDLTTFDDWLCGHIPRGASFNSRFQVSSYRPFYIIYPGGQEDADASRRLGHVMLTRTTKLRDLLLSRQRRSGPSDESLSTQLRSG